MKRFLPMAQTIVFWAFFFAFFQEFR